MSPKMCLSLDSHTVSNPEEQELTDPRSVSLQERRRSNPDPQKGDRP